jgi:DNA-binding response OmpR family regulator
MDRRARLLVVDDVPQNARLLEAMLSPHGYVIALAFSGYEGLAKIATEQPDVVLVDILMPDITGYEVCRRIRADPATRLLPVVMLTSSRDQDKVDSIEAGADDFIARPLDPRELLSRIRSLLRIKEYQDAVQVQATQLAEWNQTLEKHFHSQLEQLEELERLRRVFSPPTQPAHGVRPLPGTHRRTDLEGTFQREGEYWTVEYDQRVVRVRDGKGMRILARLLADSGRPFAAVDLARLGLPADRSITSAVASSDAGELLDEDARRAYRARIAALGDSIEAAQTEGRSDEAGLLREEMDFIVHELSRAFGLGGRPRRAGSIAERSRLNVARAARTAMQRIALVDPVLGAHLMATIHTGTVCVYTPDPRVPIVWRVSIDDTDGPRGS